MIPHRHTLLAILFVLLCSLPLHASAASITSAQIDAIVTMLQAFGADASVIANVETALRGQAPSSDMLPAKTSQCLDVTHTLYSGSSDATTAGDVSRLQRFLDVSATGYFGPETERAVQKWQVAHNIVSSGTPDTTGYGVVGPQTNAAMGCAVAMNTYQPPQPSANIPPPTPETPAAPQNSAVTPPVAVTPVIPATTPAATPPAVTPSVQPSTPEPPAVAAQPAQTVAVSGYDIYSPDPVMVSGTPRLYFGGWLSTADLPHDSIYAASCGYGSSCSAPRLVISAVTSDLYQINDPTIVHMPATADRPAYMIMYMTGSTGTTIDTNGIYYATSWETDGYTWSKPKLLLSGFWLPSATKKDGQVVLYANSTTDGRVAQFNLGSTGIVVPSTKTYLTFDNSAADAPFYSNVDVVWRPSIHLFQMVAERQLSTASESSSVIDYLTSTDGVAWHLAHPNLVTAAADQFRVGSPAQWPDSASWLYYGSTAEKNSMGFSVRFSAWDTTAH